mmetsp:Transcript_15080/g.57281  ORF Transcript_15080/g.57281 Transcript_15080/m.57281 type:complete len:202 (+) Transcript_15080:1736-2341(+)
MSTPQKTEPMLTPMNSLMARARLFSLTTSPPSSSAWESMRRFRYLRKIRKSTMATASFSTDSPNTSEYSSGSQFSSALPMMLSVATGSTALISAPNSRASSGSSSISMILLLPQDQVRKPTTKVETTVPPTANIKMVARFAKKRFLRKVYPASKMIGGNSAKKKTSGWKRRKSSSRSPGLQARIRPPTTHPTSIAPALSGI